MAKTLFDRIGRETANQIMEDAIRRATERRVRLGLPEIVKIDGKWCLEYPDGRRIKFDASKGVEGILEGMKPEDRARLPYKST